MTLTLFIFLSGVLTSKISALTIPDDEPDVIPYLPEDNPEDEQVHSRERSSSQDDEVQKEKQSERMENELKDDTGQDQDQTQDELRDGNDSFDDKNSHSYKDVKNYMFTTKNPNGSDSEVTVRATTDLRFSVKNFQPVSGSLPSGHGGSQLPEQSGSQPPGQQDKEIPKESPNNQPITTPHQNESEFWTNLAKVFNQTTPEDDSERNQFFKAIPGSDVTSAAPENPEKLEKTKLRLMLGISLMTLFLFVILLAICSAVLYKMKTTSVKKPCHSEYSINPELAAMSYFQPAEGVSDTSFSKSAESSTYWGTTSTEIRQSGTAVVKTRTTDMVSTASEEIGIVEEADMPQDEEPSEGMHTDE